MREKGAGFYVYPGVPALLRTATKPCLWIFSLCTEEFPEARNDEARISRKKEHSGPEE